MAELGERGMDAARPTIPGTKVARRAFPGGPWELAPPEILSDYILRDEKSILFICHFNNYYYFIHLPFI